MGKKVYDPIHDVFQDQIESESNGGSPVKKQHNNSANKESSTSDVDHENNGSDVEEEDEANDSTESEDNSNVGCDYSTSVVPSVATNKKKMKESSKYNRHLKKPDGEFFSRKDLQFHFLHELLVDKRLLFTNIFKEVYAKSVVPLQTEEGKIINVTDPDYDARVFIFNDKLTFSQIYILALASSTKCSKVLRDKLLLDQQVAFSTCILGLLVNIGRLNTTINFYLEMTSQLRTFHSVPVLQHKVTDLKSLQDTPRLKSILKNLPVGNEPINLAEIYESSKATTHLQNANVVNLLFTICDNVSLVNLKLISKYVETNGEAISLFNILDFSGYEPADRCNVLLWLLYTHAETDLTDRAIKGSVKLFTDEEKIPLRSTDKDYDEDPKEEYDFGMAQKAKRKEFLQKIEDSKKQDGHSDSDQGSEAEPEPENENTESFKKDEEPVEGDKNKEKDQQQEQLPIYEEHDTDQEPTSIKFNNNVKSERQDENNEIDPVSRSIKNIKTETNNRIDRLIEMDQQKVVGNINNKAKTQTEFFKDLAHSQKPVNLKRKDLGLIKVFNEYEDIPMASVIGIRGKKRKKFKDNVLGFETDYLNTFAAAKKLLLKPRKKHGTDKCKRFF